MSKVYKGCEFKLEPECCLNFDQICYIGALIKSYLSTINQPDDVEAIPIEFEPIKF